VMTIDESGVPGYNVTNWFGLLVPGQTPQSIVKRINSDVARHLDSADFSAQLVKQGAEPAGGTPAEFGKVIRVDIDKFSRIVKAAGIRVE